MLDTTDSPRPRTWTDVKLKRELLASKSVIAKEAVRRLDDRTRAMSRSLKEASDRAAEITRLRAIVEKLPKTADGVPVVPGDELWVRHPDGGCAGTRRWWKHPSLGWSVGFEHMQNEPIDVSSCYSTREAAEAAKEGGE